MFLGEGGSDGDGVGVVRDSISCSMIHNTSGPQ